MAIFEQRKKPLDYGRLLLTDYFVILYCVVRMLVWELPIFVLTYPYTHADDMSTSFSDNLQYLLPRRGNEFITTTAIRFLSRPPSEHLSTILTSRRYSPYHKNIYQSVVRPRFSGYWITQNSLTHSQAPRHSDLTIFYLHGGGYQCNQAAHCLLFLLRIAESIFEKGKSVSIFALDYSLAPECTYPTQLEEAAAAYEHLVDEEMVPPAKMVIAGDSAGGHLALSLLVHLNADHSTNVADTTRRKPGGLALISPWLSLHQESPSFVRNKHKDILSVPFLRHCARLFLGHNPTPSEIGSPFLEFLNPQPQIDWKDVLPSQVWVSAGEKELFFDSIATWVEKLRGSLGQEDVIFEVGVSKVHDWQWLETMLDGGMKKAFLDAELDDGKGFESIADVGRAILGLVKEG